MANEDQLKLLRQGVAAWNRWREENPDIEVDLSGADLSEAELVRANLIDADLSEAVLKKAVLEVADLSRAILIKANLYRANLWYADLSEAVLNGANLVETILIDADLSKADLTKANLSGADLCHTNLNDADLTATDLAYANLVETTLVRTKLTDCRIYGISAWGLKTGETIQNGLIITPEDDPEITVDNLQVAQFIYLLLDNEDIRQVIDTMTSKVVLILGRFTPQRKVVLDAIRDELRKRDYLPVVFDFDKPTSRDLTESISTLAHMSRFIIADITEAKSIPAELQCIVPNLPSVPVVPLVMRFDDGYALFKHIRRYDWVLEPYEYESQEELIASLCEKIIAPAEIKVKACRSF
jgi:uncharacterized protein YjbI with pentapeptide repeats